MAINYQYGSQSYTSRHAAHYLGPPPSGQLWLITVRL